uniref:Flavin-containing monooxygenase n=1 Tax=Branchiostoma floridae TaxID=7739 RepID=C3ZNQ1_BRAFL|eukprot:XP_002589772.1 hypothetical protein BRAFLDRAFT_90445 [Branchiostoma floridae]
MVLRVAVIGAGANGLCAARYLSTDPGLYLPTVYEQTAAVGGTWVYTDRTGTDEHGLPVHSSMYTNLRTNIPKESMAFSDFPFDSSLQSYLSRQEVLQYLEGYAAHFGLNKYIQFLTRVEAVTPVHVHGVLKWHVTISDVSAADKQSTEQFDAVMVCTGRYSVPYVPAIPGTDRFQGRTLHSHDYRVPEPFRGRNVVIIGASASGIDLCVQIAAVAERVVISHSNPPFMRPRRLPPNVSQVKRVESIIGPNTVRFMDGQEFQADDIIYCTGYCLSFPFLTPECGITVHRGRAFPLYKHVINTTYPTMSFIGIVHLSLTFPLFEVQVRFALGVLSGRLSLPSKADMDQEVDDDFKNRLEAGLPPHHAHTIEPLYRDYVNELAIAAKCEPIPQTCQLTAAHSILQMFVDPVGFRNATYKIAGPESFERVPLQSKKRHKPKSAL